MVTKQQVETYIENTVRNSSDRIFQPAKGNVRQFILEVAGEPYKADLAFRIDGRNWLFIEDDEAQTADHNAAKYWRWIEYCKVTQPIYLVHIIHSNSKGDYLSARLLAKFICEKMKEQHTNFNYYPIETCNWEDEDWKEQLTHTLGKILKYKND